MKETGDGDTRKRRAIFQLDERRRLSLGLVLRLCSRLMSQDDM
jgi:hypothetical protein